MSVELLVEALRAINAANEVRDAAIIQLHRELAEIRDGLLDLDHDKAPAAQLRELGTRVDDLEHAAKVAPHGFSRRVTIGPAA